MNKPVVIDLCCGLSHRQSLAETPSLWTRRWQSCRRGLGRSLQDCSDLMANETAVEWVDRILREYRAAHLPIVRPPYVQGEDWWNRPGLNECRRGFNFHDAGSVQRGKPSQTARFVPPSVRA